MVAKLDKSQVDRIVQSCLDLYSELPKTGKPVEGEWTVMSCLVQYDIVSGGHEVVSLGSGSKCVGAGALSAAGDRLNDSHAEVVARRALLLYLLDNVKKAIDNKPSVFRLETNRFILDENIQFIFYSSQLPCGDASIVSKDGEEEFFGDLVQSLKRHAGDDVCRAESKRAKEADIHRTGAKCLPELLQDPKLPGAQYHLLGQVRTKPGRGDRTLSVSCSDKMARWVHMGVQGALLDLLCGPIFISHFIFGAGVPYSEESLKRAMLERFTDCPVMCSNPPQFYQSTLTFPYKKSESNLRPAAGSVIWSKVNETPEVAVQGRKLGLTKKKAGLRAHSLSVSKYKLYERLLNILLSNTELRLNILGDVCLENVPYNQMKMKSKKYYEKWMKVKENFFKAWTVKPDIWDFCVKLDMPKPS
ncbi:tRNA-specific adenosine deaminase 1 [Pectinophora gossypiella]|uniref:tRNA-specific adenosine deaminase 1 n=1 Tax=Pectinophora gossypiella TaxID=13191 RepID=UPI00214F13E7|nr:tRNA-specific adenosine deaminase 1 [Pectinophora gossypiella]